MVGIARGERVTSVSQASALPLLVLIFPGDLTGSVLFGGSLLILC